MELAEPLVELEASVPFTVGRGVAVWLVAADVSFAPPGCCAHGGYEWVDPLPLSDAVPFVGRVVFVPVVSVPFDADESVLFDPGTLDQGGYPCVVPPPTVELPESVPFTLPVSGRVELALSVLFDPGWLAQGGYPWVVPSVAVGAGAAESDESVGVGVGMTLESLVGAAVGALEVLMAVADGEAVVVAVGTGMCTLVAGTTYGLLPGSVKPAGALDVVVHDPSSQHFWYAPFVPLSHAGLYAPFVPLSHAGL